MQASPSPALIEQSRRNAKRLAKQADIPLNQAQDQIAQSFGFGNWSQFAKARDDKPAPTPAPAPMPRGPRRYLHGDQDERNPAVYYCAECDFFGEPDHFDRPHPLGTGQRIRPTSCSLTLRPRSSPVPHARLPAARFTAGLSSSATAMTRLVTWPTT
jgi:hypothetical protein